MSGDLLERTFWGEPEATPERVQAWAQWKDDYVNQCIDSWVTQGASHEEAAAAAVSITTDLAIIDGLPWMSLGRALAAQMDLTPTDEVLTGEARTQFVLSLRTLKSSTDNERTLALAYQLGISVTQAEKMRDRVAADSYASDAAGETALYRYYDANGVLLYVGIARDPEARDGQHGRTAQWHRFVADREVEWFATREQAVAAERDAITAEDPIFNQTHNRANRQAALDYLFGALEAGVTSAVTDGAA